MPRCLSAETIGMIAAWFATLALLGGCNARQEDLPGADLGPTSSTDAGPSTTEGTTDLARLVESVAERSAQPQPEPPAASLKVEIVQTDDATDPAVGTRFAVEARIVNSSQEPFQEIRVRLRCDAKLEAVVAEFGLTDLAAGDSHNVAFNVLAKASGPSQYTIEVTREGGRLAGASGQVTIIEPGEPQPPTPVEKPEEEPDRREPKTAEELGPPLGYKADEIEKLIPKYPVWVTADRKSVLMVGQVCQRQYPLELFACLRGSKEHESVLVIDTAAYVVHAALLAVGAEPGSPVEFYPDYKPASGTEIEIEVVWATDDGEIHRAAAQDWVRDAQTDKAMEHAWVFAGSRFLEDERTGEKSYRADLEGDLICVSNFPGAVLDLPIRSSDAASGLLFEAFTENIPPLTTAVTLVMTPK